MAELATSDSFGEFEIREVLGRGGTATVYSATRNGEPLALKVLREDIQLTEAERKRFLAEADLLARLSHPGVIRVLDAGVLPDGRPYLALPLLHGETLARRLGRGAFATSVALAHCYAAADAITTLHRAGLLHRDLKPENFFLDEDDHLILLDFGIARDPDTSPSTSTQQGQVRGTPAYMAPERFFGVAATEASEVYELAATLHVMLAGALPWSTGADLDARLDPKLSPAIPRPIASVLRGALAVRVEARPPTVAAFVEALRASEHANDPTDQATTTLPNAAAVQLARAASTVQPLAAPSRRWIWLAVFGAIVAAGAITFAIVRRPAERYVADLVAPRRTVVVLRPRSVAGVADDDWMATAIAERTRIGLEVGGSLATPGADTLRQLSLDTISPQGIANETLLHAAHVRAHADIVVVSSFLAEPDHTLRLTFVAQSTQTGVVVASASATGTIEQLGALVTRAVGELRTTLGDGPAAADHERVLVDSLPSGGEASRLYAEGLACLRRFESVCAKDQLERAVALSPNSALAHAALAEALHGTGADAAAKTEAARAVELGRDLPEEPRLTLEAHAAAYAFEWPRAIEVYTQLATRWPDDLRYALGLADAQASAGKSTDAYATLDRARKTSSDPRLDFVEAAAADRANDFAREAKVGDRAAAAADALGEQELGAYARLNKGWALVTLGRLDEAKPALDEALRMFGAEGDRYGTARAIIDLGTLLESKADYVGARRMYEEALRLARELGNQQAIATVLLDLGQVLVESGDAASARARDEEALGIARQISDVNLVEEIQVNLGSVASNRGDTKAALDAFKEALELAKQHAHPRVIAAVLVNRSNLEEHMGDENAAVADAELAVAEARKTDEPGLLMRALTALAEHEAQAGRFDDSLKRFAEVEAAQVKANDHVGLIATRSTRVTVLSDAGRDTEAEQLATEVLKQIDAKSDPDDFGWMNTQLGQRAVEKKELDRAAKFFELASSVVITAGDAELSAELRINKATLAAARGDLASAQTQLAKVRVDAGANGEDNIVLESDIVSAEIAWHYGHDRDARARLGTLAKTAREHGAGTIARIAERAMTDH